MLYKDRKSKGIKFLIAILIGFSIWSGIYIFQWISTSERIASFLLLHTFIGVYIAVHSLLYFTLNYIGVSKKIFQQVFYTLTILGIVFLLIIISDNLHKLTITNAHMELRGGNMELVFERGPVFMLLGIFYPAFISFVTLAILIYEYIRSNRYNKPRIFLIILGTIVPWFFSIISLTVPNLNPNQDLAPIGIPFTAAILTLGVYRYNLLEFMPVISSKIINDFPEGVFILNENNAILEMNPIAESDYERYMKDTSDTIGKFDLQNVLSPALKEDFKNKLKSNPKLITLIGQLTNGKFYDIRISMLHNKNNNLIGSLIIYRDITDLETAKETLKDINIKLLETNKTKDLLFKIISHDLRGPIGSLRALIELMITDDKSFSSAQKTNLDHIYKTSDNVYRLLTNLLDWSKNQLNEMVLTHKINLVYNTIDETINQLKPISEIKHITIFNHSKPDITGYYDEQSVMIVLRNILANAIKFSMNDSIIDVNVNRHKADILITLTDYGVGMEPSVLNQINQKQFVNSSHGTNNEIGSGLGLFLSHDLIALNKGNMWATSTQGKGTSFFITIPATDTQN